MQSKRMRSPEEQDSAIDEAVMGLLLVEPPGLWAVEEVVREIGDPVEAKDSLARLRGAGLIHRLDGFVLPTRTAVHCDRLGSD